MKIKVYATLAIAGVVLNLTACKVASGGYYAGSGIYDDCGGYDSWQSGRHDSWNDRENDWNDDRQSRNEQLERDRYENQTPNDNSDLHPPGVIPRTLQPLASSPFKSTDSRVIFVAGKYDISDYAATYIVRAVELAKANDDSGIKDLGLNTKDFEQMMKTGTVPSEKMVSLASKLLMPTERAEQLLFDIRNDIERAHQK